MSNRGLIEYKDNIITRIKSFFKKIFKRGQEQYNYTPKVYKEYNEKEEKRDKYIKELKVNYDKFNKVIKKDAFLREIEKNDEVLNMLSIERLRKLELYYNNVIMENEKIIKELKSTA